MPKLRLLALAALLVTAICAQAQEPALTNADVVRMAKAGLSADTIIVKIRASRTAFRTDTDSLIELAEAKVPDTVIRTMLEQRVPSEPSVAVRSSAKTATETSRRKRFENVSVFAPDGGGRCTQAALELTTAGLETRGCHETDVRVLWKDAESVCYTYGSRPAIVIRTSGSERRISVTTPADLKALRDAIRSRAPKLAERTDCR